MSANPSKSETVIRLLRRSKGASISQLQSATGWQPHSIRAALTKLRMAGHDVARRCKGSTWRYFITRPGTES